MIKSLKDCYRIIYRDGLNRTQALEKIRSEIEPIAEVQKLVKFYEDHRERGVA